MAKITEESLRLKIIIDGDNARKRLSDLSGEIDKQRNAVKQLEAERKKAVKTYGEESAQVKNITASLKNAQSALDASKSKYQEYKRQVDLTGMTLKELQQHLRQTKAALANAVPGTEQWKKLNKEVKETSSRLSSLKGSSGNAGKAMAGIAGKVLPVVAAISGVAKVVSSFTKRIGDFEQANVNLSTVLGTSVTGIRDLTNNAKELGRTTEYTASQVTSLQTEFAKLGFSQSQIMAMTEPTLNFATAVGTDLPSAAKLAGATLRMFGLQASDTKDVLSVLAVATNKSALDFSYLQTAMSIVGPVAKTFGFSVRDTTALLGTLANAGFDASSAATATRNILLNLANSSGKLAQELGKPVKTFPELMDGLKQLSARGVDLNTTLELTDKRSVAAFNSFLQGADNALELRDSLEDVNGELDRIANERMNTVQGSVKKLQSAWEGFVLAFSNSKGPIKSVLDTMADGLNDVTDALTKEEEALQKRGSRYAASMINMYGFEEAGKVLADESRKTEERIKNLRKALDEGIYPSDKAKKTAKKELKELQDLLDVQYAAQDDYKQRVEWENSRKQQDAAVTTPSDTPTVNPDNSSGSGNGSKKNNKAVWSLQNDESFLLAKAELTRRYNEGEIASQELYNEELYNLEVSSLSARLALNKDKGQDRAKIEADLQDKIASHNAAAAKKKAENEKKLQEELKRLEADGQKAISASFSERTAKEKALVEAENERYTKEKAKYDARKNDLKDYQQIVEALERQHQINLLKIKQNSFDEELKDLETKHKVNMAIINKSHAYELASDKTTIAEKQRMRREEAEARANEDIRYLTELKDRLSQVVADGMIGETLLTEDQRQTFVLRLNEVLKQLGEAQAQVQNLGKTSLKELFQGTGGSLFGVSQEAWDTFFANLEAGKLKASDLANAMKAIGGMAEEGFKLAQTALTMTAAREKEEFDSWKTKNAERQAELEKSYTAGLLSEAQYNASKEQMEADADAKQAEMELKQARRSKSLSVAQSIIQTSLSVMKTFTEWGGWPAGVAPAAIMAAIGAAQTAMIAATPVSAGAAEGGPVLVERSQDGKKYRAAIEPDKRGYVNRPTVIVGEEGSEYVIPHDGVANPSLAPVLRTIESARQRGMLRNINFDAVYPSRGYASGGATIPIPNAQTQDSSNVELVALLKKLSVRLDTPLQADVVMTGRHGLVENFDRYNRNKATNGKLG